MGEDVERKWTWLMWSVTHAAKRGIWLGHVLTTPNREEKIESGTHHSGEEAAVEGEAVTT